MKKSALFTAAVPAVFSVALSLSLLACSDDAPAVAPVLGGGEIASSDSDPFNSSSSVSGKGQSGFQLGACKRNALDVLAKDASVGETRKAYLVNDSAGTHVVLPDVDDYCGYYGEVTYSKELSGDTLIVVKNMKRALPTNCRCIYDFRIDLDVMDLCAKYVRYGDVYEIVTERIINELENGIIPWEKPWTGVSSGAYSRATGRPYSILNQLLLRMLRVKALRRNQYHSLRLVLMMLFTLKILFLNRLMLLPLRRTSFIPRRESRFLHSRALTLIFLAIRNRPSRSCLA